MADSQTYRVDRLIAIGALIVGDGYRAKNDELGRIGLPFARAGNINNGFHFADADRFPAADLKKVGNKVSLPGDVVFTSKGSVGRFAYVDAELEKFVYSPQLCFWRSADRSLINPRFLYYWMHSPEFFVQYKGVSGQTDMAEYVSLTDQRRMYITLPPIGQQEEVARILGLLDDKIDLNRRMNETLETMARAIFKDWFVDFGPTRAKMEGRPPYLVPDLWPLFPDRLDDEGRPVGWREGPLSVAAEVVMGASPDGATYNDEGRGVPLVNGPVEYGSYFLRKIKWTTAPTRMSKAGDFIICVRGSTTGRHCYADDEYCLGRGVAAVRSKEEAGEFISETLLANMPTLLAKATGSVFPNISGDDIRELSVMLADSKLRSAFAKLARPLKDRIWSNVREAESLAATRDLLLPKLMSGEIRVRDAERELAAAQ